MWILSPLGNPTLPPVCFAYDTVLEFHRQQEDYSSTGAARLSKDVLLWTVWRLQDER
jgi:hypothetical protein